MEIPTNQLMQAIRENRIGRFILDKRIVHRFSCELEKQFFLILDHAEYDQNRAIFTAYSSLFETWESGELPVYRLCISYMPTMPSQRICYAIRIEFGDLNNHKGELQWLS